jgi:large subunit ribosomal protein L30
MAGSVKVKLIRSMIGRPEKHRKVLRGMGLTRLNKTVEFKDTPEIRGMINKVSHLVSTEEKVDEAMNYRRLQNLANPINGWAAVLAPAGARPQAEAPKGITVDPVAVSDPVMKAGRCQFNGDFPSADLPIFSEKKSPS